MEASAFPIFEVLLIILLTSILGVLVWVASATHFMYGELHKGEYVEAVGEEMDMGLLGAAHRAKQPKKKKGGRK